MAKKALSTVCLAALLALASSAATSAAVLCFDTAEITLASTASYNATQGSPNPFDLDVSAQVTSPLGHRYTVAGFFDGNGAGGAVGNIFKVRIYTDESGTWRWTINSNVPGLNGRTGAIVVSPTRLAGSFGWGPVVENPHYPRTFMYQEGVPVFLAAKFLDAAAPNPIKYSHTMLSEKLTDANRQALLSRHLGMKLNKINVYISNRGDYSGVSTTPWVGTAQSNDKSRFDLARWKMYDQWLVKMRDAGVLTHFWFFADDSSFGNLPDADRQRLIKYAMARFSGYVNTMFVLALEWQEGWSATEVASYASFIHQNNPWARMVSVHGTPGNFAFPTAAWADYMDVQAGNSISHGNLYNSGLVNRALSTKPLIQEEHGMGQEDTLHRQRTWAAFLSGAAGIGTGGSIANLMKFLQAGVRFERMTPDKNLVLSGGAYALAEKGSAYVFYLYNGGTAKVDLRGGTGTFIAEWYDPRNGSFRSAGVAAGGATPSFTAPASGDWVLYVHQ
jgi:hypothetical protein